MRYPHLFTAPFVLAAMCAPAMGQAAELSNDEFCAGSPLTVGSALANGGAVTDIHIIAGDDGKVAGWIYSTTTGESYVQTNGRMRLEEQQRLGALAGEAVSELRPKPRDFPAGLTVRACRPAEMERF